MASSAVQTATRKLGKTEANWVAAVEGGTGITITSILFERRVHQAEIEGPLEELLAMHPRLRSLLVLEENELSFHTPEEVFVRLSVIDRSSENHELRDDDTAREPWHLIAEEELNISFPQEYPFPVFEAKLYLLSPPHSNLILRVHAAAADMASTAIIVKQIIGSLHRRSPGKDTMPGVTQALQNRPENFHLLKEEYLPSVEDGIPPGQANKPFWAHGVDVVGYGLVSRRHAYLPFEDSESPRVSKLIRANLTADATSLLFKECEIRRLSIHGVINAAALKAVAAYKQVSEKGELYGTTVLLQCRNRLQPPLPDSSIGFYHGALMRTVHTSETVTFWELATRCTQDFDKAIKNRKHFTDMGDLNGLMVQAMRFPNLTPSGSLRTSVLSTMFDPVAEELGKEAAAVGVKDYLSCSSTHGSFQCIWLECIDFTQPVGTLKFLGLAFICGLVPCRGFLLYSQRSNSGAAIDLKSMYDVHSKLQGLALTGYAPNNIIPK